MLKVGFKVFSKRCKMGKKFVNLTAERGLEHSNSYDTKHRKDMLIYLLFKS
jgi:hypothetical protein